MRGKSFLPFGFPSDALFDLYNAMTMAHLDALRTMQGY